MEVPNGRRERFEQKARRTQASDWIPNNEQLEEVEYNHNPQSNQPRAVPQFYRGEYTSVQTGFEPHAGGGMENNLYPQNGPRGPLANNSLGTFGPIPQYGGIKGGTDAQQGYAQNSPNSYPNAGRTNNFQKNTNFPEPLTAEKIFNPQAIMSNISNASGVAFGKKMGGAVVGEIQSNITSSINKYTMAFNLKYYFEVTTSSVSKKILIILIPFFQKNWIRVHNRSYDTGKIIPLPPCSDLNAPDLYIPLMSVLTYIILYGIRQVNSSNLEMGDIISYRIKNSTFSPEALLSAGSKILTISIIETVLVKFVFYLSGCSISMEWLDVLAICGYKYLGVAITYFSKSIGASNLVVHVILAYTLVAFIVFMLRTLSVYILLSSQDHASDFNSKMRLVWLFIVVAPQLLSFGWFIR